ncbi:hypothetical protein B0J17DRAFT_626419 [Rhizoctonia solani]|nr:hypothetical protein B0J17DRAFT_626419 [Rhizoctonia solani]
MTGPSRRLDKRSPKHVHFWTLDRAVHVQLDSPYPNSKSISPLEYLTNASTQQKKDRKPLIARMYTQKAGYQKQIIQDVETGGRQERQVIVKLRTPRTLGAATPRFHGLFAARKPPTNEKTRTGLVSRFITNPNPSLVWNSAFYIDRESYNKSISKHHSAHPDS